MNWINLNKSTEPLDISHEALPRVPRSIVWELVYLFSSIHSLTSNRIITATTHSFSVIFFRLRSHSRIYIIKSVSLDFYKKNCFNLVSKLAYHVNRLMHFSGSIQPPITVSFTSQSNTLVNLSEVGWWMIAPLGYFRLIN